MISVKRKSSQRELWRKFGAADVIIYIFLGIVLFLTFFPFWNAVVLSFNEGKDAQWAESISGPVNSHWKIIRRS